MSVTVWSKPHCVQCNAVYKALDKGGVPYEVKNLPDHPEMLERVKDLGFLQAPVVESGGIVGMFAGFNPGLIAEIVAAAGIPAAGPAEPGLIDQIIQTRATRP